jgi:hypothetical protein
MLHNIKNFYGIYIVYHGNRVFTIRAKFFGVIGCFAGGITSQM